MDYNQRSDRARRIRERCNIARDLREQASALSNKALAEKFEVCHRHIGAVANGRALTKRNGRPRSLSYDDALLIRQAVAERDRLKSLAALHSHKRIAEAEGVSLVMVHEISMGKTWDDL